MNGVLMIHYETMQNQTHADAVCAMMQGLYHEDTPASGDVSRNYRATIDRLLHHPACGQILLALEQAQPIAYTILIPYWSNEFGGTLLFVDELYVLPAWRGRGVARGLFAYIEQQRPYDETAVFLEVSATNARAFNLYQSLGFSERANKTMVRPVSTQSTAT